MQVKETQFTVRMKLQDVVNAALPHDPPTVHLGRKSIVKLRNAIDDFLRVAWRDATEEDVSYEK